MTPLKIRSSTVARLAIALAVILAASPAITARAAGDVAAGRVLALKNCVKCHGTDGKGDGPEVAARHISPPPGDWTDKEDMSEHPDVFLRNIIEQGGAAMDKSPQMPAFGKKLTPAQIDDLIDYIRTFSK
jgi:mono/diheme cytochrome c family protein